MQTKFNRRHLLGSVLLGTLTIPVQQSNAVVEKVSIEDPKAKTLGYVEDAEHVDIKHFPTYKTGQTCANCTLIQLRYGFFRPCTLFPDKTVSAKGWCSAWAAKTYQK